MRDYCANVLLLEPGDKFGDNVWIIKKKREQKSFPSGKEITIPARWGWPGGRKDPEDKNEIQTAIREVAEELGVQIDIAPNLKIVEMGKDHDNILFLGYLRGGRPKPRNEEIITVRLIPVQALEDPYLFQKILGDGEIMYKGHQRKALKLLWLRKKITENKVSKF